MGCTEGTGAKRTSKKDLCGDMQWIYNAVTMGNPMNYQFDFCLWTLNAMRALIQKELDIKLSKSSVSRYLGTWD